MSIRMLPRLMLAVVPVVAVLTAPAPAHAQCPSSFAPVANYAAGVNPISVAVGDFNADGRPDLAVANRGSGNVSILLGNGGGGGTFQAAVNYAVGSGPASVAVGDFNADGRPDLAVANADSNNVSILRGTGPGRPSFGAATNFAVGSQPLSVVVGFFNADFRPDLAVANANSGNVSILMGNASGTFQAPVNYAVGSIPIEVAVGDFNADGRPDLAVANQTSNNVSILLGNPPPNAGTFQARVNYAAGDVPISVAVGDFNADGRPDLAVANNLSDIVSVLLNTTGIASFPVPTITQQPASQIVQAGQIATIAITANGFGNTLTYQWRKNGVPVVNGGNISGATTPTLTFTPALSGDTESYDVVVTAPACGGGFLVTTSAAGILAVTGTNPCPADFNIDGELNPDDLADFIGAFFAGCG